MTIKKVGKSWSFRIEAGTDPKTGKRKQVYRSGFKTKREAQEEMIKLQNEIDEGIFIEPSKDLFKDFITIWVNSTYKSEVQITSFEKAQTVIRVHLIPYFQSIPLAKITTYEIDQFYATKLNEGLSNAYVKIMHNILSKAFQKALQWELIKTNPVKEATPPRISKTRKQTWTVDEAKFFLEVCERENYLIPFQLAIFTGMRRGEILALRWRNVDLVKGVIFVEENLVRSKNKGLLAKELKTDYSLREIFISESVITSLQKHKTTQDKMKVKIKNFKDLDLVVCAMNGNYLEPRNLIRKFKQIIKKANLPVIPFHNLRHTHATILMRMGENPKIVSERLGHSRVETTLGIYSHSNEEMQKNAADRFDEKFGSN